MINGLQHDRAGPRDDLPSFDAWLVADLRDRFGAPLPVSREWLDLIDATQTFD